MTPAEFSTIRKRLGLTQAGLAPLLGYGSQVRIAEIENGQRNASNAVARLLRAYADGYRPDDWPQTNNRPASRGRG